MIKPSSSKSSLGWSSSGSSIPSSSLSASAGEVPCSYSNKSPKPSSSLSSRNGSLPSSISSRSIRPSRSVSSSASSSGSCSPASKRPLKLGSSVPSLIPPRSVSAENGSVVVLGSLSSTNTFALKSVSGSGVTMPLSVPSYRPSLSESGSKALTRPS